MGGETAGQAHHRAAGHEGLDAERLDVLAGGAGGGLVLADRRHDPAPGRGAGALEQEVEHRHDRQHQRHQAELVPRLGQGLEGLGHHGDAARAVGRPGLVLQDQAQNLGDADGGDGQVVGAQPDADAPHDPADRPADHHRRHQPDHHRQLVAAEMAGAGRRGQDRADVGADHEEAGDAGVEQPGEAELDVQAQRQDRVDPAHGEQRDDVEEDAIGLIHR